MIKPHGSERLNPLFVQDESKRNKLLKEAEKLPSIIVCSAAAANAVMMGGGYFNPLTGYMNKDDALAVAEKMRTTSGLFFPVPILNMTKDVSVVRDVKRIALKDPNVEGNPVIAIMDIDAVEEFSDDEMKMMTEKIFHTDDPEHPGVEAFNTVGKVAVSGPIQVLNFSYFAKDFPDTFRTAYQIREEMAKKGWQKVVAFQMRDAPDHTQEDFIVLSGTKVRSMMSEGLAPPKEFTRPEVADILMKYYQGIEEKPEIKLHRHSGE